MNVFPYPKQEEYHGGEFVNVFEDTIDNFMFYTRYKDHNMIVRQQNSSFAHEEYRLVVQKDRISIEYGSEEGFYRAMTSLYMLAHNKESIQLCNIYDKPDFKRRGYMLDISRGSILKKESIKKLIDILSLLKYNEFQLYMENFCYKYSEFPEYTKDFDCLTAEDIRDLDSYCRERFIDLVPNQNCFGHMANWLAKDELKHLELSDGKVKTGTLNPLDSGSYDLAERIFESLLPNFSSDYVNIGLDEADGLGEYQSYEYCREHGKGALFMEWLNKIRELVVNKYNKKPMFWSDMIINEDKEFNKIPKDAIALEWGYELIQSQLMNEHCLALKNKGVKFYVCPSCNTHCSFTGRFDVTSFNLRTAGEIGKKYGAEGYLVTEWASTGHPRGDIWQYLPMALGGEYAWNVGEEQNGENFKSKYIRGAKRFVDTYLFGGAELSEHLYRVSNYYLLEPERVHVGTICGLLFNASLEVTNYAHLIDLKNCSHTFYFENLLEYIAKIVADVKKIDFDINMKNEFMFSCKVLVLAAELCILRIDKRISSQKRDELLRLTREIELQTPDFWFGKYYESGSEHFMTNLNRITRELSELDI